MQVRGRGMIREYERTVVRRATNQAYAIMNLSRGCWTDLLWLGDCGNPVSFRQFCTVLRCACLKGVQ